MIKDTIKNFVRKISARWFPYPVLYPAYGNEINEEIKYHNDYNRYASVGLALNRISVDQIDGDLAEVGVFRGELSSFIHKIIPERKLYLFDSFKGFAGSDIESGLQDNRFKDTNVDLVYNIIGDRKNIIINEGFVPDTFKGLESVAYAFVMIDLDKYQPILDSLIYFYERIAKGGYILVHDYNSPESDYGSKRAVNEFMADKPEFIVDLPDARGTVLIRKV